MNDRDPRLAELDRKWMLAGLYNIPGIFCLAGGLLGTFGEPGEIPFEFLTHPLIANGLLVFGLASFLWFSFTIVKLTQEKTRIREGRKD